MVIYWVWTGLGGKNIGCSFGWAGNGIIWLWFRFGFERYVYGYSLVLVQLLTRSQIY